MSDDTLAAEVHGIVEPGLAADEAGAQVQDEAIAVLTSLVGEALAATRALSAQMAAQHEQVLAEIAALVVRQSGL